MIFLPCLSICPLMRYSVCARVMSDVAKKLNEKQTRMNGMRMWMIRVPFCFMSDDASLDLTVRVTLIRFRRRARGLRDVNGSLSAPFTCHETLQNYSWCVLFACLCLANTLTYLLTYLFESHVHSYFRVFSECDIMTCIDIENSRPAVLKFVKIRVSYRSFKTR